MKARSTTVPRHRQIYEHLHRAIINGEYAAGERLPSELELGRQFDTSRITVAKAVNELQKQGLVSRRAGSGTHVRARNLEAGHVFGLLIPDLGRTEIFEPICHGMMRSPIASPHSLLWGHTMQNAAEQEEAAEQLCHHYIAQKVSGVFFAPLEYTQKKDAINRRIVSALERAKLPVLLLDRCYMPYPDRSRHDLVGTDNQRTGFIITTHLLRMGVRRTVFLARPLSAPTVDARASGWREAQYRMGIAPECGMEYRGDPEDEKLVKKILTESHPEAFVCANDLTALKLMQTLNSIGVQVPNEVRIVGIDDVIYAGLLPTPLTTQHQNCGEIGSMAMAAMLERLSRPDLPTRDILLQTRTIVRESCGVKLGTARNKIS